VIRHVACRKYHIYTVRRESHVTLEATSSVNWLLFHPIHRCKPTDCRGAVFASSVYSTSKTNRTYWYALFVTGRTGRPNDIDGLSLQYYWRHWRHYRSPVEFRNVCNSTPILWCCSIKHGGTSNWTFAQQRCRESITIAGFSFLRWGELWIMPHHSQNGCLSTRNGAIWILNISPDINVLSISYSKRSFSKRFLSKHYLFLSKSQPTRQTVHSLRWYH
jgi:hypothetical protein